MTGRANNNNTTGNGNGRPILAERFRTKLCEKFQATGECPYEWRCMFAHGEHELRTKERNLADDLVTETAIKAFQKAREVAAKAKQKELAKAAAKKAAKKKASAAATPVAPPPSPESAASAVAAAVVLPTVVVGRRPSIDSGSTSATATPSAVSPVFVPADAAERSPASVASGPRAPSTNSPRAPSYDASKYVSPLAAAMLGHRELVANAAKPQAARLPCTVTPLCVPSAYEDAAAGTVHAVLLP